MRKDGIQRAEHILVATSYETISRKYYEKYHRKVKPVSVSYKDLDWKCFDPGKAHSIKNERSKMLYLFK